MNGTVLFDTNIYISAILFGGKPKELITLARSGELEVVISEHILWEIREVLSRKFKVPETRLNAIEHDVLNLAKLIHVSSELDVISQNAADNKILACAVDGHVDAIITGDNHLLSLEKYQNILILTPQKFIKQREGIK